MTQAAHTPTIERAELTIEEEVNLARVRANLTDERIDELMATAQKYLAPIESAKQYAEVKAVEKQIKKVRVIGDTNLDQIDRRRIDRNKMEMRMVQEVRARIHEPELLLASVLRPWEQEQERLASEANEKAEQVFRHKCSVLEGLGFVFTPSRDAYVLGDTVIQKPAVMAADGEVWGNMLKQATLVSDEVAAQKAEEERLRKEQQEAFDRQQEELARLKEEQAQREREALEQRVAAVALVERERLADLRDLGVDADMYYQQHRLHETVSTPLASYEDSEWPMVLDFVKEKIERIKAHDAEVEERRLRYEAEREELAAKERLFDDRAARLKGAGWDFVEFPTTPIIMRLVERDNAGKTDRIVGLTKDMILSADEQEFQRGLSIGHAELTRRKAEEDKFSAEAAERQKAEEDAKRLREVALAVQEPAGKSDLERFEDWLAIIKLDAPALDSAQADHGVRTILKYIDGISPGIIEALKQR